jgi:cobalt/nickel transport protein
MKQKKQSGLVLSLLVIVVLLAIIPLFVLRGAEFGGSDDAGSQMVSKITGQDYQPWFTPVLETMLGGELPGEVESLMFCIQTGIGVGIIAFGFGYLVAAKNMLPMKNKGREGVAW